MGGAGNGVIVKALGAVGRSLIADMFSLAAIASCIVESARGTGSAPGAAVGTCGCVIVGGQFSLEASAGCIATGADSADELTLDTTDVGG